MKMNLAGVEVDVKEHEVRCWRPNGSGDKIWKHLEVRAESRSRGFVRVWVVDTRKAVEVVTSLLFWGKERQALWREATEDALALVRGGPVFFTDTHGPTVISPILTGGKYLLPEPQDMEALTKWFGCSPNGVHRVGIKVDRHEDGKGSWRAVVDKKKSDELRPLFFGKLLVFVDEVAASGKTAVTPALYLIQEGRRLGGFKMVCPITSDGALRVWVQFAHEHQLEIEVVCFGIYQLMQDGFELPQTDCGPDGPWVPERQRKAYHTFFALKDPAFPICIAGDAGNSLSPDQVRSICHLESVERVWSARSRRPVPKKVIEDLAMLRGNESRQALA